MPYLEHQQRLHRLLPGEHVLGSGKGCAVQIAGVPEGGHAEVRVAGTGVFLRALGRDVRVEVNGEPLGTKARELAHGDTIRVGRAELLYIDERQVGGTSTAEAASVAAEEEEAVPEVGDYADAGGSLRRWGDRKEIPVGAPLFRIGREAGCDLVIPESQVSRVHAEIRYQGGKYVLYDLSTNGTWVNGRRMSRAHVLSRGDSIKVGEQVFEFECESVPLTPAERARLQRAGAAPPGGEPTERVKPRKRRGGGVGIVLFLLLLAAAAAAYFLFLR